MVEVRLEGQKPQNNLVAPGHTGIRWLPFTSEGRLVKAGHSAVLGPTSLSRVGSSTQDSAPLPAPVGSRNGLFLTALTSSL